MKTYTTNDFKKWGAQGGSKSRRTLTTAQSQAMAAAKAAKRKAKESMGKKI